jgi:hypothetical protein
MLKSAPRTPAHLLLNPRVMKTGSIRGGWVGALVLAALATACTQAAKTGTSDHDLTTKKPGDPADPPPAAAAPPPAAPAAGDPAPPAAAVATAKIHDATVKAYTVTADAVWIATSAGVVQKTALDGTSPTPQASLAGAAALATDGTRVYALLDHIDSDDLVSVKGDGTDLKQHASWTKLDGDPTSLSVHDGRVYLTVSNELQSGISSISATAALGDASSWRLDDSSDSGEVPPAFGAAGTLFTVDYVRQSALRVATGDFPTSIDMIDDEFPRGAGGVATDGTDVYTRTSKGIVKVAVGSGANTQPIVVIPSATCSIFDPGDGTTSNVEDTLAIDGSTIYVACRAAANVEVRTYGKDGKLGKVVGAVPYAGGLTHLRVAQSAVYWLSTPTALAGDHELWRGAK